MSWVDDLAGWIDRALKPSGYPANNPGTDWNAPLTIGYASNYVQAEPPRDQPPREVISNGEYRLQPFNPAPRYAPATYTPPVWENPFGRPPLSYVQTPPAQTFNPQPVEATMVVRRPLETIPPSATVVGLDVSPKEEKSGGGILGGLGDLWDQAVTTVTGVVDKGKEVVGGAGSAIVDATADPRLKILAAVQPYQGGTVEQRLTGAVGPSTVGAPAQSLSTTTSHYWSGFNERYMASKAFYDANPGDLAQLKRELGVS